MPESLSEMKKVVRKLGSGCLLASDASKAIAGAARDCQVVAAPGARHIKQEFTPIRSLLKRHLPLAVRSMLESRSSSSTAKPSVRATKRKFEFVQGDNLAENKVGGIKNKLRRAQLKGRSGTNRVSVDTLFAAHKALSTYRKYCMTSGYGPAAIF